MACWKNEIQSVSSKIPCKKPPPPALSRAVTTSAHSQPPKKYFSCRKSPIPHPNWFFTLLSSLSGHLLWPMTIWPLQFCKTPPASSTRGWCVVGLWNFWSSGQKWKLTPSPSPAISSNWRRRVGGRYLTPSDVHFPPSTSTPSFLHCCGQRPRCHRHGTLQLFFIIISHSRTTFTPHCFWYLIWMDRDRRISIKWFCITSSRYFYSASRGVWGCWGLGRWSCWCMTWAILWWNLQSWICTRLDKGMQIFGSPRSLLFSSFRDASTSRPLCWFPLRMSTDGWFWFGVCFRIYVNTNGVEKTKTVPYWYLLMVGLVSLQILHFIWAYMVCARRELSLCVDCENGEASHLFWRWRAWRHTWLVSVD